MSNNKIKSNIILSKKNHVLNCDSNHNNNDSCDSDNCDNSDKLESYKICCNATNLSLQPKIDSKVDLSIGECKIFVGNIPYQCTQEEFEKCFQNINGFMKAEIITI